MLKLLKLTLYALGFCVTTAVATSMKYILVRDLWARSDVGIFENSYTALDVQPHACRVISIRYVSKQFKSFIEARLGKFKDALSTGERHFRLTMY